MKLAILIFLVTFIIYYLSSSGPTPYNYFTRLSQSFLSGKLYLLENPSWLDELIPVGKKYYVVYPPMPAVVSVPFVLLFGPNVSQTLICIFIGSLNVALVYLLIKRIKFSEKMAILIAIFFGFGTNYWYLVSNGSAWFFAHILALFFLLLAILETFGKKRLLLIGLFIGAGFWSRTTIIFTLPFFYVLLSTKFLPFNKRNILNFFVFNFGIILFFTFDVFYNYLRFGNFNPLAPYKLIPNVYKVPDFRDGFMSLRFIPRHVDALLFRPPFFQKEFPFIIPNLYSMAIWITSPALVYVFWAKKTLSRLACWAAILPTLFIISLWAGVGYAQFGYRFLQDVMPFLLILSAFGIGQRPKKLAYILISLSILVNLWGILMINKFNLYVI